MSHKLPKNWKDITIEQYADIYDVTQQEPDSNDLFWGIEQKCKLLSVITGESFETLYEKTPTLEIKKRFEAIEFISTDPDTKPVQKFKLNGIRWRVEYDITKLTAAEYIDLTELTKESHNIIHNAPQILSLFCKPTKWSWTKLKFIENEKVDKATRLEILKDCPVSVAYPLTVFFCKVWSNLTDVMDLYLNQQLSKVTKDLRQELISMNDAPGS